MNLIQSKSLIVFFIVFMHNTFLDLFLLGEVGEPVFLWEKSLEPRTIYTHIVIAMIVALVYKLSVKCRELYPKSTLHVSDVTWGACSVGLLLSIVFILL